MSRQSTQDMFKKKTVGDFNYILQIIDFNTNTTLFKGREHNGPENDVTVDSEGRKVVVRFDVPDEQLSNGNLSSVEIWMHTG